MGAVPAQPPRARLVGGREDRPEFEWSGDRVRRRLALGDAAGARGVEPALLGEHDVEPLTVDEFDDERVPRREDGGGQPAHLLLREGEGQVAGEHGDALAEPPGPSTAFRGGGGGRVETDAAGDVDVRRGPPAAGRGLVHHVVLQEPEDVEEFDGCGEVGEIAVGGLVDVVEVAAPPLARHPGEEAELHDPGPDELAAGADEVTDDPFEACRGLERGGRQSGRRLPLCGGTAGEGGVDRLEHGGDEPLDETIDVLGRHPGSGAGVRRGRAHVSSLLTDGPWPRRAGPSSSWGSGPRSARSRGRGRAAPTRSAGGSRPGIRWWRHAP